MTKEQFDELYAGENVAVHCDTEEKAKEFLGLAHEFGYKWNNETSLLEITYFGGNGRKETVYYLKDGRVLFGYLELVETNGYKKVSYPTHHKLKELIETTFNFQLDATSSDPLFPTQEEMNSILGLIKPIVPKNEVPQRNSFIVPKWISTNIDETFERSMNLIKKENAMEHLTTITFNKKTFKTTLLFSNGNYFITSVVTSNKQDFVDFRVGFLLAWLKHNKPNKAFKTLIGQLFYKGKPQITFLRGYALKHFDSLRQMDKILDAIKNEKDQVNIGGEIIKIVWKG